MFERLEKTLDDVLAEPEVRAALKLNKAPGGAEAEVKAHVAA